MAGPLGIVRSEPPPSPDPIARAAAGELLDARDLMAIFQIKKSRFYKLQKVRAFDCFKVHPPIGPKCFSGRLITRYLAGESIDVSPRFRFKGRRA